MNETSYAPRRSPAGPLRILVVVLAIVAVGLVLWAVLGGGDDESEPATTGGGTEAARVVTVEELADLAAAADGPIYWAGELAGAELEYSEAGDGYVYVRYLTGGAEAGDPRPAFLSVATYPLPDPVAALRANARRTDTELRRTGSGALAWVNPDRPRSVYLAEPGSDYQVEVFDPSPRRALAVALSGDVVTVE